jgi:hypothetical protein
MMLLDVVKTIDRKKIQEYRDERNYEDLELFIIKNIMGR